MKSRSRDGLAAKGLLWTLENNPKVFDFVVKIPC